MYLPKHFAIEDDRQAFDFIEQNNFGILVTDIDHNMNANHIPFFLDREHGQLFGHFAKSNNQWRELENNKQVLVIFPGPHAYISPSWYVSENLVPTWNFAAVHIYGEAELLQSKDETYDVVKNLTQKHEAGFDQPWTPDKVKPDVLESMLKAIVGFKINIKTIQTKAKLSQNRSGKDQTGAIEGLRKSGSEQEFTIAKMMQANLET